MENSNCFMFFANCLLVKSFKRSVIYDLQREKFKFIPNSLYDILKLNKNKTIKEIIDNYSDNDKKIIMEYFDFLVKNEYIFFAEKEEIKLFPKLSINWNSPSVITNSIIDIKEIDDNNFKKIIEQLEKLGCKDILLRFYKKYSIREIDIFLNTLCFDRTKSIQLISPYIKSTRINDIKIFQQKNPIILSFIFYNADINKSLRIGKFLSINLTFIKENIIPYLQCGFIFKDYFVCNPSLFTESQHYNTCLNRKICIDVNGEIKNCPSMQKSFGNIKDTTLAEAIEKPGFKDLWGIRKDDIDVCKDCEFRYMCTDCRCFIKDPNNIYSQPAKCPYNPYICKWEGEEEYITVEKWRTQNPNWEKKAKRKPLVKKPQPVT